MTSFIFEGRGLAVFLNRKKDCYLVKIAILFWWEKLDSNQRSLTATDLQSAPIDQLWHSPGWLLLRESNLHCRLIRPASSRWTKEQYGAP